MKNNNFIKVFFLFIIVLSSLLISCVKQNDTIEKKFNDADRQKIKELKLMLNSTQSKGLIFIELGDIYLKNRVEEYALNFYNEALKNLENKQVAIIKIAGVYINRRDYKSAVEFIDAYKDSIDDINYLTVFLMLSDAYIYMKDYERNIALLEYLDAAHNNAPEILFKLIEAYLLSADYKKADIKIETLKSSGAAAEAYYYYKALYARAFNRGQEAENYLRKIIDSKSNDNFFKGLAYKEIGKILFIQEQYENAKLYFEKAAEFRGNDAELFHYIGLCLKNQFSFMLAADNFYKSVTIDYSRLDSRYILADIYFHNLKLYKEAMFHIEILIVAEPENINYLKLRGDCAFLLNQYDVAIISYKKIIELEPFGKYSEDAFFALGTIFKKLNNNDAAFQYYEAGADFFGGKWEFYFNMGLIYEENAEYEKALDMFLKTYSIHPELSINFINIGNAYFRLEKYEDARDWYNKALKTTNNPDASYNLSLVQKILTDKNKK